MTQKRAQLGMALFLIAEAVFFLSANSGLLRILGRNRL